MDKLQLYKRVTEYMILQIKVENKLYDVFGDHDFFNDPEGTVGHLLCAGSNLLQDIIVDLLGLKIISCNEYAILFEEKVTINNDYVITDYKDGRKNLMMSCDDFFTVLIDAEYSHPVIFPLLWKIFVDTDLNSIDSLRDITKVTIKEV